MKTAKKLTALILVAFALALCIVGCDMPTTPTEAAISSPESPTAVTEPTAGATPAPTEPTPSPEPTSEPTIELTAEPTAEPTVEPTAEPTAEPTVEPTTESITTPIIPNTTTPPAVQFVSRTEEDGWTYVRYQIKFDTNAEFFDFGYKFKPTGFAWYGSYNNIKECGFVIPMQILSDSDFNVWGAIYDGNTLLNGYPHDYQSIYGSETGGAPSNLWITRPGKFIYNGGYGKGSTSTFTNYSPSNHDHTVKMYLLDSSNNSIDIVFSETVSFVYTSYTTVAAANTGINGAKTDLLEWTGW